MAVKGGYASVDRLKLSFCHFGEKLRFSCVSPASSSLGLHPDSIENGSSLRLVFPEGTNVSFEKDFLDIPETPVEVYRGKHIEYWDAQKNDWVVGPLPSPKKGKQFSN